MKLLSDIHKHIILYEGLKLKPYKCTSGATSIGYGRNLDSNGISQTEANMLLENDIENCFEDLETVLFCSQWGRIPEKIKLVLLDMRYNLGPVGIRGFRKMLDAVRRYDWAGMRKEMMDSKWYNQIGRRGIRLIELVDEVIDENTHL